MMQLTRSKRYLLSSISGILMVLSFPYTGSLTPLVFVAWIPLLLIENNVFTNHYRSGKVFIHAWLTFLIYNLGTTWWIWNASEGGACMAIGLNSLIMALVFLLFHKVRKKFQGKVWYILLPVFWIAFEFLHFHWELSWPWLQLGNVFSILPSWVQWYSVTGVLGGTLWILTINILLFFILKRVVLLNENWKKQLKPLLIVGIILLVPLIGSLFSYYFYEEKVNPVEVVVVQPNIDPYTEKFNSDLKGQLDKIFVQANKMVTPQTQIVIAPETAISTTFLEERLADLPFFPYIVKQKDEWKNSCFYTGASTVCFFDAKNSTASRKLTDGPGYIESYNTSLFLGNDNRPVFVHKSKLVLGVEKLPFLDLFPWLEQLAIDLDGASGSLGIEKEPKVIKAKKFTFAPSICYESIYGEFISKQVNKGAEFIFVITNDGWWGNTPGYKQHASFSSLRAIENRRSVARSANTGISCFINQRGEVLQQSDWWVATALREKLNKNEKLTIYSKHGDVLGRFLTYTAFFVLLFYYVKLLLPLFRTKS